MPTPNFEKLNRKIREAGANWIAGETPYSKYHGRQTKNIILGLATTPEQAFAALAAARKNEQQKLSAAAPPPPPKIDWRNHNGKNWVTSVKDQKSCGSCVAFAAIGSIESRALIQFTAPNKDIDLSEAHLFYCGTPNSCDIGWYPAHALNFAATNGVGYEVDFPYTPKDQACKPIKSAVKVTGPSTAATSIARKQALLSGPVIGSMAVYDDFYSYKSGIYRHVVGNLAGYHAVCVVGYDDGEGCWIVKNSWNSNWGEAGFFRIRYGECGIDTQFPFNFPQSITLLAGTKI